MMALLLRQFESRARGVPAAGARGPDTHRGRARVGEDGERTVAPEPVGDVGW